MRLLDHSALIQALRQFADDRDWQPHHTPRNLLLALTGEVGELAEVFQWMTDEQAARAGQDPATAQAVQDELADVLLYLVRLADVLGVDLDEAVSQKMAKNAVKYPAFDRGG